MNTEVTEMVFDKICDQLEEMNEAGQRILLSDFLIYLQEKVSGYNPMLAMYDISPFVLASEFHVWSQRRKRRARRKS